MEDLAQKKERYVEELQGAVRRIGEVLSGLPEVEKVILFGSYARGSRTSLRTLMSLWSCAPGCRSSSV